MTAQATPFPTVGSIERLDPAIDAMISKDARIERLADGFDWAEGPVWRSKDRSLVFSDVPKNVIHQWRDGAGVSVFMRPSGFTGPNPPGRELGSNGLTLDRNGALVMADHGNRQIARVNEPLFTKTTIAAHFEGKRFNSPNDVIVRSNGDVYFTDPPFGLARPRQRSSEGVAIQWRISRDAVRRREASHERARVSERHRVFA
jgi:gluconolactonase